MTKACPFCAEQIPRESRVCKFCHSALSRKCPFCAEEIGATERACPICKSDLASPVRGASAAPRAHGPLGEERGIALMVILTILTCGIWGIYVQYKIGDELDRHQGKGRINAGLDLLLTFVTCGLWFIYVMYKYPRALQEITVDEGAPPVDLTVPCLLLTIFGFGFVALAILQNEMNKHWDAHRGLGPRGT
jgi:hypothetical protein